MLYWFLLHNMNQYKYPSIPSLLGFPPLPHPIPPLPSRHRAKLSSLRYVAASCWLSILHRLGLYVSAAISVRSMLSFPCHAHKSVLNVCVSSRALQIGPSVPFF